MSKTKKIIINTLLLQLSFFCVNGQVEIKKIIYDDLILINQLYNYQIIDTVLVVRYDTMVKRFNYSEIIQNYERNVVVSNIDTFGNFYVCMAEFKNVRFNCYPKVAGNIKHFRYLLYKKGNRLFKINGFITSDVLFLAEDDLFALRYVDGEKEYQKRLTKALKRGDKTAISSLLTVSILRFYKDVVDPLIEANPIISIPSLNNCEVVE